MGSEWAETEKEVKSLREVNFPAQVNGLAAELMTNLDYNLLVNFFSSLIKKLKILQIVNNMSIDCRFIFM